MLEGLVRMARWIGGSGKSADQSRVAAPTQAIQPPEHFDYTLVIASPQGVLCPEQHQPSGRYARRIPQAGWEQVDRGETVPIASLPVSYSKFFFLQGQPEQSGCATLWFTPQGGYDDLEVSIPRQEDSGDVVRVDMHSTRTYLFRDGNITLFVPKGVELPDRAFFSPNCPRPEALLSQEDLSNIAGDLYAGLNPPGGSEYGRAADQHSIRIPYLGLVLSTPKTGELLQTNGGKKP